MWRARCASTRRSGICWIAITAWSRRRSTEELVADDQARGFRTAAGRAGSGRHPRIAGDQEPVRPAVPPAAAVKRQCPAKIRLVLRPFAMHGVDGDHAHLVQGFQPASGGVAGALPRMERGRPAPAAVAALPAPDSAPQYCIETTAYQAGAEINMVMVLRDDTDRHLCLERKLPARPRQLVRGAAAHHPPDRDLAERAVIGRTADAARRRARRLAGYSRPLAPRAEFACRNSMRKAGSARSPSFAMPSGKIPRSRLATAASCR